MKIGPGVCILYLSSVHPSLLGISNIRREGEKNTKEMKSDEDNKKRGGEAEEDIRIDTGVCILYLFHFGTSGHFEVEKKKKKTQRISGAIYPSTHCFSGLSIQPFRVI